MTPRLATLGLLSAATLAAGCSSCDKFPSTALTDCRQGAVVQGAVKTDILFVVDNSGSMSQEQANLKANLAAFVAVLKSSPVANDFQLGVTSTTVQDFNGSLMGLQGKLVGPPLAGSSGTLVADFGAQVDLAAASPTSGKEQPLRAMKLALTDRLADSADNAAFLRPGARLAVIFLSDEDDNSESLTNVANTNPRTHNDAGDGVDYKFTVEDPISDYVGFLTSPIGGEVRDVVLGAIVGVDATVLAPTCGDTTNHWCCGSTSNNTCVVGTCGSNSVTYPATAPNLTMGVYCCGGATTACTSTCPTAFDKGDRFVAFMGSFPSNKTVTASICDSSFATSLSQIAGLIVLHTVPLSGAPADPAMLVVRVTKADGTVVPCTLAAAGTPAAATADAVYDPPLGNRPATITFSDTGACKLDQGYKIQIDVICAG